MRWIAAVLVAMTAAACSYDVQGEQALFLGDADRFMTVVQPVVGPRCATLDCHGDSTRPLPLFAEHGLRLEVALRGEPISLAEAAENVVAMAAVGGEAEPADHLALLKPLAVSGGGMKHEGGDIWLNTDDPAHTCLLAWLSADDSAGADTSCVDAQPPAP